MVPKPRLCTLVKQTTYDEYGFNLHAERGRGHYIGIVDEDSVGDYAGLQAGQRLVGVNGHLIYPTTTHREVLELIKADPLRVELLLASEDIDRWHAENQIPYSYENHIIFRHATQQHNGGNHQDGDVHTKSTIQSTTMGEQKSNILSQHRSNEVLLNNVRRGREVLKKFEYPSRVNLPTRAQQTHSQVASRNPNHILFKCPPKRD